MIKANYTGPLPMAKGMGSIRARQNSGTEKWPAKMCQWIAAMLLATCTSSATSASKGSDEVLQQQKPPASEAKPATEEDPPFPTCPAEGGRLLGGVGPPRICKSVEKKSFPRRRGALFTWPLAPR